MNDFESARAAREAREAIATGGSSSHSSAELAERAMNRYFAAQAYENRTTEASSSEVDEEEPS